MAELACQPVNAQVVELAIPLPLASSSDVVSAFRAGLEPHASHTRLVVLDHITSNSALLMPVSQLVDVVRELCAADTAVLIDGAHALGSVRTLNVTSYGADYYCGNCHKWFCTPKGCGFMWVKRERQQGMVPRVISVSFL